MRDADMVVLAIAVMVGAVAAREVSWFVVGCAAVLALTTRRTMFVWLAAALLASTLSVRAERGVAHAPTRGSIAATATIVRDPEWRNGAIAAEMRLGGRRVQAFADGDAGAVLGRRLAGERVRVRGRLRPLSEGSRAYLARRHIGSRLAVTDAEFVSLGGPVTRLANQLRRTLVRGAASLPPDRRALFTGLVLGDDRDQSPAEVDDFQAAGLGHLLAVSGQNVAFALAVAGPLLRRLSLYRRLAAGLAVLAAFGVLTRWEPSVLRAVVMAGLTLLAATVGRPAAAVRVIAMAVTVLVLIDPLLAGSVGFLLSVGACTGIAVLAPWLVARRVPGPLAVTVAAQVGVAPVLIPVFGSVPLASLPANILAAPAAGPVMMWGLAAGVPAGVVGGPVAAVLHLPTRLFLWWIASVAHTAAGLSLPEVDGRAALVLAVGAAVFLLARRRPVVLAVVLAALILLTAGSRQIWRDPAVKTLGYVELADGLRLWRSDTATVLVVGAEATEGPTLRAVRRAGLKRVDLVVATAGGSRAAPAVAAVRRRVGSVEMVVAPRGHRIPDATAVHQGQTITIGRPPDVVTVDVTAGSPRLEVRVRSLRAPRARSPPVRRHHSRPRDGHPQSNDRLVLRQGCLLHDGRDAAVGRRPCRQRRRHPRRRRRQGWPRS